MRAYKIGGANLRDCRRYDHDRRSDRGSVAALGGDGEVTAAEMIAELSKHPPGTPVLYVETSDYGKCYLAPELRVSKMLETDRVSQRRGPCV